MMERLATGIAGLDEMLDGGFFPETAVLVEGAAGTGKTTLGLHYIVNGVTRFDQPGIVLTFEEFPRQFYHDAAVFGWDLRQMEAQDKLRVIMSSPEVMLADIKDPDGLLAQAVAATGARRILVDSFSHFALLEPDPVALRRVAFTFINALKRLGLTVLLTWERSPLLGGDPNAGDFVTFLADGYIMLRYVEMDSTMQKAILILKLRGSRHARDIRRYEIMDDGLHVEAKFEGHQRIMSGYATSSMAEAFVAAFGRAQD
ncbi:MAG: ATPase [Anaerolineae bacterium]|nr:ATPase [Anaerolineae bacterium]